MIYHLELDRERLLHQRALVHHLPDDSDGNRQGLLNLLRELYIQGGGQSDDIYRDNPTPNVQPAGWRGRPFKFPPDKE